MFRKHFENIVPFSEFILVLLQAYGFIISTSVCMFHIHACQWAVCGALSSSCKMGEQAVLSVRNANIVFGGTAEELGIKNFDF